MVARDIQRLWHPGHTDITFLDAICPSKLGKVLFLAWSHIPIKVVIRKNPIFFLYIYRSFFKNHQLHIKVVVKELASFHHCFLIPVLILVFIQLGDFICSQKFIGRVNKGLQKYQERAYLGSSFGHRVVLESTNYPNDDNIYH